MATSAQPRHFYEFGPFRLDPAARVLLRDGEVIPLAPKIVDTLMLLVENRGNVVEKDKLLKAVWPDTFVEESNLTNNVSILRKVLADGGAEATYIQTIPKRGYRFVAGVREVEAPPSPEEVRAPLVLVPRDTDLGRPAARARSRWLVAAVALGALAVFLALWHLLRTGDRAPVSATFTQLTDQPGQEVFPSLSPDGRSFVYASRASGNWDIYFRRVAGKNPINLTGNSPADDTQPAFSPDGDSVAFRSERDGGGIFVMGATGESVRRVTDFGYNPAWSPDGREIVCATAGPAAPEYRFARDSRLFAVSVAGGDKRLLSPKIEYAAQPQWSPHGHRIAYLHVRTVARGARREIWTVAAQGSTDPVPVIRDAQVNWNPVWSPDGRYLYFSSDRGGSMNLWRVRINEKPGKPLGEPEPVTTPSPYSGHLTFSRDGRRIAYVQQLPARNIQKVGFDPFRHTAAGEPVVVTRGSRELIAPDVSPDGEWLAFTSWGQQEDVFVARTDGSDLRQLTNDAHKDRLPRWSPDGGRIAFYSDRSGRYEIWTINRDGSELRQLTHEARGGVGPAVWSPDGARLAYCVQGQGVHILEVAKPWAKQSPQALPPLAEPNLWLSAWSWSPDGRKLVVQHWRTADGVTSGFSTYSLESRKYERLADFGSRPRWLKDNRRLLFHHEGKLWLIDSQSRKTREILSAAPHEIDGRFAVSPDNHTIYFSRVATEADVWLLEFK